MGSLPDNRVRRIAIIGAGPAGITAAKLVTQFLHRGSHVLSSGVANRRSDTFWRKAVSGLLMSLSNRHSLAVRGIMKGVDRKPELTFHKSTRTSF